MQLKQGIAAAAAALFTLASQAQSQAPGLWENTVNVKSPDGRAEKAMAEMQQQMAAMPPEQRKQMEAAMAKSGMSMGAQGAVAKTCITREQAARPVDPEMQGNCKTTDVRRAGSTVKFKFECSKPASSGEGEWTFASDKAFTGKVVTQGQGGAKAQPMTIDMSGKWLAADCGDVKPRTPPAK